MVALDQARGIINDSTLPVSDLKDPPPLSSGTFPSLAAGATLSLVLEIPNPISEVPAPSQLPSALLEALQPTEERERPAVANVQFSFEDSPPPSPNQEIGLLQCQLEEASKHTAMYSDAFYHFFAPLNKSPNESFYVGG